MKTFLSVKEAVAELSGAVSAKPIYAFVASGVIRSNRALGKVVRTCPKIAPRFPRRGGTIA